MNKGTSQQSERLASCVHWKRVQKLVYDKTRFCQVFKTTYEQMFKFERNESSSCQ